MKRKPDARSKLVQLDYSKLKDTDMERFCNQAKINSKDITNIELASSMKDAATKVLPKKSKPQPGWFQMYSSSLLPLIDARNSAMDACFSNKRLRSHTIKLRAARKKLKEAVVKEKICGYKISVRSCMKAC